jgi:hypothetical protein
LARWSRGESEIEEHLIRRDLERITGVAANGQPLLTHARRIVASASSLADKDPYSAYVLAYDASRFACTALLAQQGLRPSTAGGRTVVAAAVRAPFGDAFRPFGTLRRRRNELEYPHLPVNSATEAEAIQALAIAQALIEASAKLLDHLTLFD